MLHGELPTTPATYAGEAKAQTGTQLRYWSICNSQGLTSGATTGPCLADEATPINAHRYDTIIVLSLPQDRPKNATNKCGVAWMNYGTAGDGYTRPDSTLLIMRNLSTTAHPAFPNAIQNITTPGKHPINDGPVCVHRHLHRRRDVPAHRLQPQQANQLPPGRKSFEETNSDGHTHTTGSSWRDLSGRAA